MNTALALLAIVFFIYGVAITMLWIRAEENADFYQQAWLEEIIGEDAS